MERFRVHITLDVEVTDDLAVREQAFHLINGLSGYHGGPPSEHGAELLERAGDETRRAIGPNYLVDRSRYAVNGLRVLEVKTRTEPLSGTPDPTPDG